MSSLINFLLFLLALVSFGVVFAVLEYLLVEKTTLPAWVAFPLAATVSLSLHWAVAYPPGYLRYGFFVSYEPIAQISPVLLTLGFLLLFVAIHYVEKGWFWWTGDQS